MKVQATYKGKTVEIDIPDEKLEELVKEQKKTGWEKPLHCEDYYTADANHAGFVTIHRCLSTDADDEAYYDGNCFTSKELAGNIARYQSLDLRIRRRIAEICEPVDWNKTVQRKWAIEFIYPQKYLATSGYTSVQFGTWFCDTKEHAEQIISEFCEELIWYFTEFKDRMDG